MGRATEVTPQDLVEITGKQLAQARTLGSRAQEFLRILFEMIKDIAGEGMTLVAGFESRGEAVQVNKITGFEPGRERASSAFDAVAEIFEKSVERFDQAGQG